MKEQIKATVVLLALFIILTGFLYPLVITGITQVLFPWQADGSKIINTRGEVIGSQNIGQRFDSPGYFWGRPSETSGTPYNTQASGGSNLSTMNDSLKTRINERIMNLQQADPENTIPIPVELVTTSASGLDPHISPAAALYQVNRVARSRHLPEETVQELVIAHVEQPFLGFIGTPRVNVLLLNLALDSVQ